MWSTQSVLLFLFFRLFCFSSVLYGAWVHLLSPSTSDVVKLCWMALPFYIAGPCFWQDLWWPVLTSTMHVSQPGTKLCSVDTEMSEPLAVQWRRSENTSADFPAQHIFSNFLLFLVLIFYFREIILLTDIAMLSLSIMTKGGDPAQVIPLRLPGKKNLEQRDWKLRIVAGHSPWWWFPDKDMKECIYQINMWSIIHCTQRRTEWEWVITHLFLPPRHLMPLRALLFVKLCCSAFSSTL